MGYWTSLALIMLGYTIGVIGRLIYTSRRRAARQRRYAVRNGLEHIDLWYRRRV